MKQKIYVNRKKRNLGHPEARNLIRKAAAAALAEEGITESCCIYVTLTDDDGIHAINLEQRDIDRPTDVLSFPMNTLMPGAFSADACEYDYDEQAIFLGDMVLSLPRAEAQGEEYGHGFAREISYLTVHSVLHLLGYDHLDEGEQKRQMRAREDAVMERLGL